MSRRYCLTLDLKDDPKLIAEYQRYHQKIWPEITESIKEAGIRDLEIYLRGTRMFMVLEVDDSFSFEKKAEADRKKESRGVGFARIWEAAHLAAGIEAPALPLMEGRGVPFLSEPWYCCAEPTSEQLAQI